MKITMNLEKKQTNVINYYKLIRFHVNDRVVQSNTTLILNFRTVYCRLFYGIHNAFTVIIHTNTPYIVIYS